MDNSGGRWSSAGEMAERQASVDDALLTAVSDEAARLEVYLGKLTAANFSRPSKCSEWSVGDVVAHLVAGARILEDVSARALVGDTTWPAELPQPLTPALVAVHAKAEQQRLGGHLLQALYDANHVLSMRLAGFNPEQWDLPTGYLFPTVRSVPRVRLLELVLHGWDIRAALGHEPDLGASASLLLPVFGGLFRATFRPDRNQAVPIRIRFYWLDSPGEVHELRIDAEQVIWGPPSVGTSELSVHASTAATLLLITGRITVAEAIAEYGMRTESQHPLQELLRARFPMP